jgi:hypothetical protein
MNLKYAFIAKLNEKDKKKVFKKIEIKCRQNKRLDRKGGICVTDHTGITYGVWGYNGIIGDTRQLWQKKRSEKNPWER